MTTIRPVTRTTLYERLRKRSYRRRGTLITMRHGRVYYSSDKHEAYLWGVRDTIRELRGD